MAILCAFSPYRDRITRACPWKLRLVQIHSLSSVVSQAVAISIGHTRAMYFSSKFCDVLYHLFTAKSCIMPKCVLELFGA